ncbi:MAG: twin-arginine translocation signal domain-containing protein [Planctomycetota bacterium]|jgi:hypothetical protein
MDGNGRTRREFLKAAGLGMASLVFSGCAGGPAYFEGGGKKSANILFAIADDWSWPHAR